MIFNSLQFIVFFAIVVLLYFQLPHRARWKLLLAASCYFYMVFLPVYIFILGFTIVVDYFIAQKIEKSTEHIKKMLLSVSLIANLGVLFIFKYYNFFSYNLTEFLKAWGQNIHFSQLSILLPIGLSFHTFQAMGYTVEVYRGNQKAERNFGIFALYVMFFPQLVAGPIERPQNLLPQFRTLKIYDFEKLKSGLLLLTFGLFKKVVIADRLAVMVDFGYSNVENLSGASLLLAVFFYAFQIYCDFSGYSDIAVGSARILGFELMENFRAPYFSQSIAEFWRRWHISLSTWFRDYLYVPLGGNQITTARRNANIFIVFLLSGFWHGANWTFLVWGGLHGFFYIFEKITQKIFQRLNFTNHKSVFLKYFKIICTFCLVTFAWIFFRAENLHQALEIIKKIVAVGTYSGVSLQLQTNEIYFSLFLVAFLLLKEKYLPYFFTKNTAAFWLQWIGLLLACYLFGVFNQKQFIYFQF